MTIKLKKSKLKIVAGILLLQSCFILTSCSNVNNSNTTTTKYVEEDIITEEDIISYFEDEMKNIEEILKNKENGYEKK